MTKIIIKNAKMDGLDKEKKTYLGHKWHQTCCLCPFWSQLMEGGAWECAVGSVWKSSPGTTQRLGPDWAVTDQDWKFQGPVKTINHGLAFGPSTYQKIKD